GPRVYSHGYIPERGSSCLIGYLSQWRPGGGPWRRSGITVQADCPCLMFSLGSSHRYYLYSGHCDMRKSFDGLCGLISGGLGRSATSGDVFVFLNRRRTHMKLLHWEHGGFVLYYKRLEGGNFPLPKSNGIHGQIDWSELVLMVEGIVVEKS